MEQMDVGLFDYILSDVPEEERHLLLPPSFSPPDSPSEEFTAPRLFVGTPLTPKYISCLLHTGESLNLSIIAVALRNLVYDRHSSDTVQVKFRRLHCTALIRRQGAITIMGKVSKPEALLAAKKLLRAIRSRTPHKNVHLEDFAVTNITCSGSIGFHLDLIRLARDRHPQAMYDPALYHALLWQDKVDGCTTNAIVFANGTVLIQSATTFAGALHVFNQLNEIATDYKMEPDNDVPSSPPAHPT
eukprot:Gregarina_sp_Poly_1__6396@NODE_340_length_9432_cov_376_033743_g285_i0_p4_GENE_NODE_340_length_9432_cov_376_033743_g285_i0NODE_340_length_9432_cov_376_033743_g285_i0_p4_ORF_typecomplete_len244_score24_73TBP/PF00352_21/1_5e08TBP/PF00352_21/1_8e07_NODE_340_length_9432_cov_376_033743_g285_i056787